MPAANAAIIVVPTPDHAIPMVVMGNIIVALAIIWAVIALN